MNTNFLQLNERLKGILAGRVAVVTGAGSGFGEAIALGLVYAGAKVGVLDFNELSVKNTVERINKEYPNCAFGMIASVTNEKDLERVYLELEKEFGAVDILINCAGIARLGEISSLSPLDIKLCNDVNINGYFLNALFASKQMIKKKSANGCIVNVSSSSARSISPDSSLYGVAKEAQCMMTRLWAADLGKYGIRVNTLLPGDLYGDPSIGISSGIWNQAYFEKKAVDKKLVSPTDSRLGGKELNSEVRALVIDHYTKRTLLAKELSYSDVVGQIILLCSDFSSKITGESITITSGNPTSLSR